METFLDTIEQRGLDWKKCMRKLKRRCSDLIRYQRMTVSQQWDIEINSVSCNSSAHNEKPYTAKLISKGVEQPQNEMSN